MKYMIQMKNQHLIFATLFFVSLTARCADEQRFAMPVQSGLADESVVPLLDNHESGSPRAQRMIDEGESSCLKRGCRGCARCTCCVASATAGLGTGFVAGVGAGMMAYGAYEMFACIYYCHKWCDKICPPENP
jgi:hypothetical protein